MKNPDDTLHSHPKSSRWYNKTYVHMSLTAMLGLEQLNMAMTVGLCAPLSDNRYCLHRNNVSTGKGVP